MCKFGSCVKECRIIVFSSINGEIYSVQCFIFNANTIFSRDFFECVAHHFLSSFLEVLTFCFSACDAPFFDKHPTAGSFCCSGERLDCCQKATLHFDIFFSRWIRKCLIWIIIRGWHLKRSYLSRLKSWLCCMCMVYHTWVNLIC